MENKRHDEKKNLAEWMRDPDIMKEVADRSGGKIKFRYAILPAETRAEAEALRAGDRNFAGLGWPGKNGRIKR